MNTKLKIGDEVKLILGKDRGKKGKILKIDRNSNKAWVSGCNIIKKVIKPRTQQEKGKIITQEAAIDLSNLMLVVKGVTSRIGFKFENEKKIRYAKRNGKEV